MAGGFGARWVCQADQLRRVKMGSVAGREPQRPFDVTLSTVGVDGWGGWQALEDQ